MKPFSIYVHIPYCLHRCPYCDFNTYALTSIPEKEYLSALLAELDYRAAQPGWKGRPVQTIYFGGGTPSLFKPASIRRLLQTAGALFQFSKDPEISLEANPGTIDADNLKEFREAGVNRLSIGAQTFDPDLLKILGRIHTAAQTEAAVEAARAAGFSNISLDLIYGIPSQTLEQLRFDLKEAVRLDPRHLSAYGLTIEKGTPYYMQFKKGELKLAREEEILTMMAEINSFLPSCGYKRYEISNFAEPGFEARHNLVYWNGGDYLGIGAGAHSLIVNEEGQRRLNAERWANYALPNKYIKEATAHGQAQGWKESLDSAGLMFEFFFLGLRKTGGVSCAEFSAAFGGTIDEYYSSILAVLADQGLISRSTDNLALTDRGFQLADSVIENFMSPSRSRTSAAFAKGSGAQ